MMPQKLTDKELTYLKKDYLSGMKKLDINGQTECQRCHAFIENEVKGYRNLTPRIKPRIRNREVQLA